MAVGASKQYHYHAVTQNTTTCKKFSQAAEAGPALLQEHVLSLREVNAAAAACSAATVPPLLTLLEIPHLS